MNSPGRTPNVANDPEYEALQMGTWTAKVGPSGPTTRAAAVKVAEISAGPSDG